MYAYSISTIGEDITPNNLKALIANNMAAIPDGKGGVLVNQMAIIKKQQEIYKLLTAILIDESPKYLSTSSNKEKGTEAEKGTIHTSEDIEADRKALTDK